MQGSKCASLRLPAFTSACNTQPCPTLSWRASNDWSTCSSPCISSLVVSDNDTTLGVSTSSPPVCVLTDPVSLDATVVDRQRCNGTDAPPEALVRPCNRFLCPELRTSWWVGPWSDCSESGAVGNGSELAVVDSESATVSVMMTSLTTLRCGTGRRWRDVVCRSGGGSDGNGSFLLTTPAVVTVPDARCVGQRPVESESCDAGACGCASDADCAVPVSNHAVCNSGVGDGACGCGPGWAGSGCSIPLLQSTSGDECSGVVDVSGACCGLGVAIDAVTGQCCGDGAAIDGSGRCCSMGKAVDACGVCGGSGIGLDVSGACCSTVIAPSGDCCVNATLDDCGVCGGTNACDAVITLTSSVEDDSALSGMDFVSLVAESIGVPLSAMGAITSNVGTDGQVCQVT